jgi:hypothetical protein
LDISVSLAIAHPDLLPQILKRFRFLHFIIFRPEEFRLSSLSCPVTGSSAPPSGCRSFRSRIIPDWRLSPQQKLRYVLHFSVQVLVPRHVFQLPRNLAKGHNDHSPRELLSRFPAELSLFFRSAEELQHFGLFTFRNTKAVSLSTGALPVSARDKPELKILSG